jgi:DNA-binding response OmpR family regulator
MPSNECDAGTMFLNHLAMRPNGTKKVPNYQGGGPMSATNVLLVDDEERFLKTTKTLLDRMECNVFTASDGRLGLAQLKVQSIDVVVLDVKMPGVDGIDILRHIKQRHSLVEVIMLTGHSTMDTAIRGLNLGAFDYLTKPCDISELQLKIKAAHERRTVMLDKIRRAKKMVNSL